MGRNSLVYLLILVVSFSAGYVYANYPPEPASPDPCSIPAQAELTDQYRVLMREFDDTSLIAFNVSRDSVIEPTMELQKIRRSIEEISAPFCMLALKAKVLAYMDSIVNVLLAFMGGASPAQTNAALEIAKPLRTALDFAFSEAIGATLTPYPTPFELNLIPVTGGAVQPNPQLTATPTSQPVTATIQNPQGANLRFGPGVNYSFTYVLGQNSVVDVLGFSADREWILVRVPDFEEAEGWIFLPLASLTGDFGGLPVLSSDESTP